MQSNSVLCFWSSPFLIVDVTFGGQWHVFRVQRQPPFSGRFASLGNHPSLAIRNVATVEVARATCPTVLANCARNFANLSRDLYSKGSCARTATLGLLLANRAWKWSYKSGEAAKLQVFTSFPKAIQVSVGEALLFCLSYRQNLVHGERTFRNRLGLHASCSGDTLGKPFPEYPFRVGPYQFCSHGHPRTLSAQLWSYLILSDTHTTFYGHWHFFRVRCVASHHFSGFACLGSHASLTTRKGTSVEVVLARCHYCSSKLCFLLGIFEQGSFHQRRLCKKYFRTASS